MRAQAPQGKRQVGGIGIGLNEIEACLKLMRMIRFDAGRYTLLDQQALDALLPACLKAGREVLLGGPFKSGILATETDEAATPYYDYAPPPPRPAPAEMIQGTRRIERVAARHDVPLAAAALHCSRCHRAVRSVVAGFRSAEQFDQSVARMDHTIPDDFWQALKAESLLRVDTPPPARPAAR